MSSKKFLKSLPPFDPTTISQKTNDTKASDSNFYFISKDASGTVINNLTVTGESTFDGVVNANGGINVDGIIAGTGNVGLSMNHLTIQLGDPAGTSSGSSVYYDSTNNITVLTGGADSSVWLATNNNASTVKLDISTNTLISSVPYTGPNIGPRITLPGSGGSTSGIGYNWSIAAGTLSSQVDLAGQITVNPTHLYRLSFTAFGVLSNSNVAPTQGRLEVRVNAGGNYPSTFTGFAYSANFNVVAGNLSDQSLSLGAGPCSMVFQPTATPITISCGSNYDQAVTFTCTPNAGSGKIFTLEDLGPA